VVCAWVFIGVVAPVAGVGGAVLSTPLALGAAVGAHLGSWLCLRLRVRVLRWVVAGVLAVAGVQLVLRGLAELYG